MLRKISKNIFLFFYLGNKKIFRFWHSFNNFFSRFARRLKIIVYLVYNFSTCGKIVVEWTPKWFVKRRITVVYISKDIIFNYNFNGKLPFVPTRLFVISFVKVWWIIHSEIHLECYKIKMQHIKLSQNERCV